MDSMDGMDNMDKLSAASLFGVANSDLPQRPEVSPEIYEEITNPGYHSRLWKGFCQIGV